MQDLYTRKMPQATIEQIYEGLKKAFNSVSEVYVKTPRIKGKIFGKYLITEQSGAYNAYDTETDFTYIKQQIIKNEPLHSKAIFQHMPYDKIYDFLEIEEGNPITPQFRLDTQSWIHTYMNNKYNLGVGSTSSLFDILPALKRRGFPLWAFHVRNG